jgi:hypothetical protein
MMTNYELAKHLIDVMRSHERVADGTSLLWRFEAELDKWRFPAPEHAQIAAVGSSKE